MAAIFRSHRKIRITELTQEEFDDWWDPNDAINRFLALGQDEAKDTVFAMMCDGLIDAVAETLIIGGNKNSLELISRQIWPILKKGNAFWHTSRFRAQAYKDGKDMNVLLQDD